MTLTKINRAVASSISDRAEQLLKQLEEEFGVKVQRKSSAKFSETYVEIKFAFAIVSADGTAIDREAEDFSLMASLYGLKAEDLGTTIRLSGRLYKIVGCRPRASAKPIMIQRVDDGKGFVTTVEAVKRALEVR